MWPISRIDFDLVLLYSASLENCFVEVMEAKQFLLLDSSTCSTHLPAKRNSILVLSFFFQRQRRSLKENDKRLGRDEEGWKTVGERLKKFIGFRRIIRFAGFERDYFLFTNDICTYPREVVAG